VIFHASIPADDPLRVARVLAELWRGEYYPFLLPRTFIVFAGDDRGSELEVAPRGHELMAAPEQVGWHINEHPSPYNEVHLNIATPLSGDEVSTIAAREQWLARVCDRGGAFKVIEFWLENKFMLELMTAQEYERYRSTVTPAFWRSVLASLGTAHSSAVNTA